MKPFYWLVTRSFKGIFKLLYGHQVHGAENIPHGAAIIAPNHASFMDPPLISVSCPEEIVYLARERLFQRPWFAWLIERLNAYPVTAEGNKNLASFKIVLKFLGENKKVVIFPEGIRSSDGKLRPLKTGVAMIALRADCPVIPVYIAGSFEAWPRFNKYPKLGPKTACVFGKPIYPSSYSHLGKREALEALTQDLEESLKALEASYKNSE